jgi:hypothetical protein
MKGNELRERLREVRDELDSSHAIRLHRAVSWLRCAESYSEKDDDLSFITAWISLNSCYAINDGLEFHHVRTEFNSLCSLLCSRGGKSQLYDSIWNNFPGFVRLLIDNKYLFPPFWKSQSALDLEWKEKFKRDKAFAMKALAKGDVPGLLSVVFDRLYVLRNQLIHGGATHGSRVNRDQVTNGKRMLLEIVPIVIETMFDDSAEWGEIFFPVIGD